MSKKDDRIKELEAEVTRLQGALVTALAWKPVLPTYPPPPFTPNVTPWVYPYQPITSWCSSTAKASNVTG